MATTPDVAMADMSDGGVHTCGVAASDGHMECWGTGPCNTVLSDAPTTGAYSFTSVGDSSSCAIAHTTATASCWGCVSCGSDDKGQCDVRFLVLLTLTSNDSFMYAMRRYRRQLHAANIMDGNALYCDGSASVEWCLTGCDALCAPNSCVQRVCF